MTKRPYFYYTLDTYEAMQISLNSCHASIDSIISTLDGNTPEKKEEIPTQGKPIEKLTDLACTNMEQLFQSMRELELKLSTFKNKL